ncbi:copper homeostasis protein cutC [Scenedesmus sp. NREL 46B-D3]|nr:copper homeostasis protein cutC [Scenedesmus sp. NREL 46B-D3]
MWGTTLEICVDSVSGARTAASAGAARIELCTALVEGGVTPSTGLIMQVRAAVDASSSGSTKLMVIVRPRGGDFVYDEDELNVMVDDIAACSVNGADGVVLGCLTPDGQVDAASTATLVQAAKHHELDITFHRAFDMSRDLSEALEVLISLGIPRVLTSGGQPTAMQGADVLAALVKQAAGRISVMAGGGVTADNAAELQALGVPELHSSAKRKHHSVMQFRPPQLTMSSQQPPSDYEWNMTDDQQVKSMLMILSCPGLVDA